MSTEAIKHGHCLCGAIQITAPEASPEVGACHCRMCRRWGGGPFMEIPCGTNVSIDGQEHLRVFDSSEWGERGFCGRCGTHLFYRIKETGQHMVPVGLFEQDAGLVFSNQVFIEEKPAYYEFANPTLNMTGAELFAKIQKP